MRIHHGLCELPDVHHHLHGEKVAIGVQAMLLIHGEDDEYRRVPRLLRERAPAGQALRHRALDDLTNEKLAKVAARACRPGDIMHNEPIRVTPRDGRGRAGADGLRRTAG